MSKAEVCRRTMPRPSAGTAKPPTRGDAKAQFNIALMYSHGQGVPQDYAEAVHWYRKAAEQGYSDARDNLRVMYCKFQGMALEHWISVIVVLLGLLALAVPQRRWGNAKWMPSALTSAFFTAMLVHELSGTLWWGMTRVVFIAFFAVGSAIYALAAVRVAFRGSKRGADRGQPPTVPQAIPCSLT